jgi:hypothetical protein
MKKTIGIILVLMAVLWLLPDMAEAQCAMCRATVENNVSTGANKIGSGLNTGILYLMSIPYLVFVVIAYLWYKQSKAQRAKKMLLAEQLRNIGVRLS